MEHPDLLIGAEHFSDAGVFRVSEDVAIVQSLDFFPPIVDDPYVYGQIAAANSLSDLYALGAAPRTAMNIVGFPDKALDESVLHAILAGGAERVLAAGAVVVGGHSVRDEEVKYGLSVTGVVHPDQVISNQGAQVGDVLVLTKALGTGFIATAARAGRCDDAVRLACEASMIALNRAAAEAAHACDVHAMTDVTGFGLAGHALEMAEASGVVVHLERSALPILDGAADLIDENATRANATNHAHAAPHMRTVGGAHVSDPFVVDPQTSGGLLVALAPDRAATFVQQCHDNGAAAASVIGRIGARDAAAPEIAIVLEP